MLRFPAFDLEIADGIARRGGRVVELPPLATRLLLYLAENRHRVVPKDELLREVWRDVRVTDSSLYQALHLLRRELAPKRPGGAVVRTVRGKGYRLNP